MRAVLIVLLLPTSAVAEPAPGEDDPAFRVPFDRLLAADDVAAIEALHAAAEAGNPSAVLAMPFALAWVHVSPGGDATEALFRINGTRVLAAAKAIDPVAALWWLDDPAETNPALLDRALALYLADETARGTSVLMTWVNRSGALEPPPDWLFDQPVPTWLRAAILQYRLQDFSGAVAPAEAEALLVARLAVDDPAAWMALAAYARMDHDDPVPLPEVTQARIAALLEAAGVDPAVAKDRLAAAVPELLALRVPWGERLDPAVAAAVAASLTGSPQFLAVEAVCAATCPDSGPACPAAFVAGFGSSRNIEVFDLPFATLISPADFFATPRGRVELLRAVGGNLGPDAATTPALVAVRALDACLADAVLAVQR